MSRIYCTSNQANCRSPPRLLRNTEVPCEEPLAHLFYEERLLHAPCGGDVAMQLVEVLGNDDYRLPTHVPDMALEVRQVQRCVVTHTYRDELRNLKVC